MRQTLVLHPMAKGTRAWARPASGMDFGRAVRAALIAGGLLAYAFALCVFAAGLWTMAFPAG